MTLQDDVATLRALAGATGYTIENAFKKDRWRLIDRHGVATKNPKTGSIAFTVVSAIKFLKTSRDRPR